MSWDGHGPFQMEVVKSIETSRCLDEYSTAEFLRFTNVSQDLYKMQNMIQICITCSYDFLMTNPMYNT